MAKNETTSFVIDEIIRYGMASMALGTVLFAPNIMIALQKPLDKLYKHLDEKDRQLMIARETKRIIRYMKSQGYLVGDYEHGLELTDQARRRLHKHDSENIIAKPQPVWDKIWRIIIYDIPNEKSSARQELHYSLRKYGCFHLQRSVLVTPFPCFDDIALLAVEAKVEKYLSYFETAKLANDKPLIKRFAAKYPETKFL